MPNHLKEIGVRLSEYLAYKKLGINQLGRMTQTSGSQIYNVINGKNYGVSKLMNIIDACKDMNLYWLLIGEGEMLIDVTNKDNKQNKIILLNEEMKKELLEENQLLKYELEKLRLQNNSLEGALSYQSMTLEAYKNSVEVLSTSMRDIKELLLYYKVAWEDEIKNRKTA